MLGWWSFQRASPVTRGLNESSCQAARLPVMCGCSGCQARSYKVPTQIYGVVTSGVHASLLAGPLLWTSDLWWLDCLSDFSSSHNLFSACQNGLALHTERCSDTIVGCNFRCRSPRRRGRTRSAWRSRRRTMRRARRWKPPRRRRSSATSPRCGPLRLPTRPKVPPLGRARRDTQGGLSGV